MGDSAFERFLREKRYLGNIAETSSEWYRTAFKWLPCELPSEQQLKEMVIRMREAGVSISGVNSYRTAINSFLKWNGWSCLSSRSASHPS